MPPTRRPLVVAVEGISGTGKSRTAAALARAVGAVPLAEAYERLVPRPRIGVRTPGALARVERTLFREELVRWRTARALVRASRSVIADTGFFGPLTYSAGLIATGAAPPALLRPLVRAARRAAARGAWGIADVTVLLVAPAAVRRRRVARDPDRHPPALAARHEAVGRWEEAFFGSRLPAAVPGRVVTVRADRPVADVVRAARRAIGRRAPIARPAAAARRALGQLTGPPRRRGNR